MRFQDKGPFTTAISSLNLSLHVLVVLGLHRQYLDTRKPRAHSQTMDVIAGNTSPHPGQADIILIGGVCSAIASHLRTTKAKTNNQRRDQRLRVGHHFHSTIYEPNGHLVLP